MVAGCTVVTGCTVATECTVETGCTVVAGFTLILIIHKVTGMNRLKIIFMLVS